VSADAPARPAAGQKSKLCVRCECSDECATPLWVGFSEYEFAARRSDHYAVANGHALASAARVVVRGSGYEIVAEWR
jgi:hypothetical protein